jgi:hypothetical protein
MAMSDRMKSIADMTSSMTTRSPERTLDQPTSDVRTSRIMDFFRNMNVDKADKPDMKTMSMPTRSSDGSITAREVQVAGEFEDMLMKNYESAVEQGYKGTFFDFLIDQMDEEFDPSSPMRVSKLPEGIMQIMKMMQDRKKV